MNDRNSCLSLLKFIACISVVFVHVPFPGELGSILLWFSQFAASIFIMTAGYYSFGCSETLIDKT